MSFLSDITEIIGEDNVFTDELMSGHTTFRVGGPAWYFITPNNSEEIGKIILKAKEHHINYEVVGNGSNLLVSDEGYEGLIILIGKNMSNITVKGNEIEAGAGALLSSIARHAYMAELTGMEFAAGIPGSLGGACYMNAGAYGGEMKNILSSVTTVDEDGKIHTYSNEEMELGYRHSIFHNKKEIIVSAKMLLNPGKSEDIKAVMDDFVRRRRDKQPLEYPSAGSTFKRPEGHFAGQLIEEAGLKGRGIGGAMVSEKHAGFVINYKNSTAKDVYDTINFVIETVKKSSGITLEPEVKMMGKF